MANSFEAKLHGFRRTQDGVVISYVVNVLRYDPKTGFLFWKKSVGAAKAGNRAGTVRKTKDGSSYVQIGLGGKLYAGHRIAWVIVTGRWPDIFIDHINGDGLDNRWSNIRSANASQNAWNMRPRVSRVLPKGVQFEPRTGKYYARGSKDRKYVHLGTYNSPESAACAYAVWSQIAFGEYARYV